jgi:hypothetical protein
MKKFLALLLLLLPLVCLADIDTKDGTAVTTSTTLDGETGIDTADGQTITGGGGDSALYTNATLVHDLNNSATATKGSNGAASGMVYGSTTPDPKEGTHYGEFDGADDTFTVSDEADLEAGDADYSLCLWVDVASAGDEAIASKYSDSDGNGWHLKSSWGGDDSDYEFEYFHADGWSADTIDTDCAPADNTWYLVCIGYDASEDDLYFWISASGGTVGDCYDNSSSPATTSYYPDDGSADLVLGEAYDVGDFSGHIDEFVWWKGYCINSTDVGNILSGSWR